MASPHPQVHASLNAIEFAMREFNTGGSPRGLSFMLAALGRWSYDDDPIDGLRFEKPLAQLKASLSVACHGIAQHFAQRRTASHGAARHARACRRRRWRRASGHSSG